MTENTKTSRGENWGIKAAHGTKWLMRKLKAFDKRCVAKAKKLCGKSQEKNWPGWLGHIPISIILLFLSAIFLTFISLLIVAIIFCIALIVFEFVYCRPTRVTITNWEDNQSYEKYSSDGSNGSDGSSGY